ncbi:MULTISPECIES: hypothetical protein [unclassified Microcoleus]|uniref:hypothetical protein n=1 Tax=unclassified Microcoleus TaxID=2642155 RepID=UPI002FD5BB41
MPKSVGCREVFRKKPGFWGPAIGFFGGWAIEFLGLCAIGFFVDGRSGFLWMGDRAIIQKT